MLVWMSRFSNTLFLNLAKAALAHRAVVNLSVNDSSCGEKTAKVGELIHIFHVNCGWLTVCVRSRLL